MNNEIKHFERTYLILTILIILILCTCIRAEKFYSYINRNGCLVFSNHRPPKKAAKNVIEHQIERKRPDLIQFDEKRYNIFDDLIIKYSKETGVDFNLIKSLILVESNFNPKARSPKGAIGLMQLMPQTARKYGVKNPYSPEENIRGGTYYLQYLINRFNGNLKLVLAAYNAGENIVQKLQRIPNYKETKRYVAKIIEIYGRTKTSLSDKYVVYTPGARFFKYLDKNGILTLTNIDPPSGAKKAK